MCAAYLDGFSNGTVVPWTSVEIPNDMVPVMSWREKYNCKTCKVQHSIETSLGDWPTNDGSQIVATLFTDITKDASDQGPLFAIPYHIDAWKVTQCILDCSKVGTEAPKGCSVTNLVSGVNKALTSIGITGSVVEGPAYISFSDIFDGEWTFYPEKGVLGTTSEEICYDCTTAKGGPALHVLTGLPGRVVSISNWTEYRGILYYDGNQQPGKAILHAFITDGHDASLEEAVQVARTLQKDGQKTCWASTLRSELQAAWQKERAQVVVVKSHLYDHDGDVMELEDD